MKNILNLLTITFLVNFGYAQNNSTVKVTIDLNVVKDDKVMVSIVPPAIKSKEITFYIPKTVPGTYSEDDYGKYIDNFKAFDSQGKALKIAKFDDNSWNISDANKIAKITYWVNDTFENEENHSIFSPAGTNIDEGKNFVINTHAFVGYIKDFMTNPYEVTVLHPAEIWGATSLTDTDKSDNIDVFLTENYSQLVENPIMYAKPDYKIFSVQEMEILVAVYSPNAVVSAAQVSPDLEKMMNAQKNFLGKINSTQKYSVLIYLSDVNRNDAQGFGALEHPTATTVVMPEALPLEQLNEQLKDIVSHEFFHILTPLTIHSKEIKNFDYNNPKMSKHLWMYEGVTEYFANLFQVNQGLISEDDFYNRMAGKIVNASKMDDTMPFTKMSAEVLKKPYKDQYLNVYEKGALIAMCLDIQIRENTNGDKGLLDLMQQLSNEYGTQKAFNDDELFKKIEQLTAANIREFLDIHVAGPTPINYAQYFEKMGVRKAQIEVPGNVFIKNQLPTVNVNPATKEIFVLESSENQEFFKSLNAKGNDIITELNGIKYNLENIYDLLMESQTWKNGDTITMKVKRDGKEIELKGNYKAPTEFSEGWRATDDSKKELKNAWLKN
ncbi:peptidase M61 [Flavobacterium sp. NST-5]|uniref:Peptidase M61 n=1 Tax=Flavobacterium ichthyis TaxID=2698827 RepID=A0ABW9Z8D0_9FLAO|nr:peptidase M61 [Flavobacterium ichthyis]NBL64874.1 peptidase M61 [Flavobacterium ichthyis]